MIPEDELDRLRAYLEGELSPEEEDVLEASLKNDPSLANALLELSREEAILTEWARAGAPARAPSVRPERKRARLLARGGPTRALVPALAAAGIAMTVILLALLVTSGPERKVASKAAGPLPAPAAEPAAARPAGETKPRTPDMSPSIEHRPGGPSSQTSPTPPPSKPAPEHEKPPPPPAQPEPPKPPGPETPAPSPARPAASAVVVARIERAQGEVYLLQGPTRAPVQAPQDFISGQGIETVGPKSLAVVIFTDKTRVELGGGTLLRDLRGEGGKRVFVETGAIAADVAKQPTDQPMVFATPHGEATVLGTTLRIVVDPNPKKGTRLEVEEGKVRLKNLAGKTVDVPSGHYAVAATAVEFVAKRLAVSLSILGALAAGMKPGTWAELETNGFDKGGVLAPGGSSNCITRTAEHACWDPISRQILFQGTTRGNPFTFIVYREDTNTWRAMRTHPALAALQPSHAADHNTVDPATGDFYHRPSYSDTIYRYRTREGTWGTLPPVPADLWRGQSVLNGGLEFFPELGGLVLVGGNQPDGGGNVAYFNVRSGKWRQLARRLPMGNSNNFIEYNPVHRVVILGGGDQSSDVYKLDSTGKTTKSRNAPIGLGVTQTVISVDPVGGKYLVLHETDFYEYDVATDVWSPIPGRRPEVLSMGGVGDGLINAPISAYGVILYVKYAGEDSKVYLYKHSAAPAKK